MRGVARLQRLAISALIVPQNVKYVCVKPTTTMDANLEPPKFKKIGTTYIKLKP